LHKVLRRRWPLVATFVLVAAVAVAIPCAGEFLVIEDRLEKADAIVVMASPKIERTYEASFLFREGFAPLVLVTSPDDQWQREMARSVGVTVPRYVDLQQTMLRQLGVPAGAIRVFPRSTYSTRQEGEVLHELAVRNGWKTVIAVTTGYHTRRTRILLRRAASGDYRVIVRKSRLETMAPRRWWSDRLAWGVVIVEYLRLLSLAS
jgi:uncharacterized SAM-binding protein YcdF (DUF218 family)